MLHDQPQPVTNLHVAVNYSRLISKCAGVEYVVALSSRSFLAMAASLTPGFQPEVVQEMFKLIWEKTAKEQAPKEDLEEAGLEVVAEASKKQRGTSANAKAVKLSCELLRLFVVEAIQRASFLAEAEGSSQIEATHLERVLPQLLLDF
ncbi:hypothetical protein O6H91_19G010700 [Diphasiastrum complanatum]|uniref:Uncharacterized protein n=1 Tax=Diphasiastrum complanatum TaxID=34168 RepID=A0ACC2AST8_DIPCM|nr:hypothetical protein O6H91_19G010700 [Diphasiastrum complanatum]